MLLESYYSDFYSLFEEWYDKYKDCDNFEEYIGLDKINDPIFGDEDFESTRRKLAIEFLSNQCEQVEKKFSSKAAVARGEIKVFRAMTVQYPDKFLKNLKRGVYVDGFEGLGEYWSYDRDSAEAYWGYNGGYEVLLSASVKIRDLNINKSLLTNLCPSIGFDEAEIFIEKGTPLYDVKTDLYDIKIDKDFIHPKCGLVA